MPSVRFTCPKCGGAIFHHGKTVDERVCVSTIAPSIKPQFAARAMTMIMGRPVKPVLSNRPERCGFTWPRSHDAKYLVISEN